jgi:hypothetical protein
MARVSDFSIQAMLRADRLKVFVALTLGFEVETDVRIGQK